MRLFSLLLALTLATFAAPASAQNLRDLSNVTSRASTSLASFRFDRCRFQRGIANTVCQADRLLRLGRDAEIAREGFTRAQRRPATRVELRDPRPDLTVQLGRLCAAGDDIACDTVQRWRDQPHPAVEDALVAQPRSENYQRANAAYAAALEKRRQKRAVQNSQNAATSPAISESLIRECSAGVAASCDEIRSLAGLSPIGR